MKNNPKRRGRVLRNIALVLGAYLLLLGLLVLAERGREGALIDTLPKAFWYSLVTMTTVGYGDLYPLTPLGRLVGLLFLALSTGVIAVLVGVIYGTLTGRLAPTLWLWVRRRQKWYVLTPCNAASEALAAGLEDGVVLFCQGDSPKGAKGRMNLRATPEELFSLPFAAQGERVCFAMDDDPAANEDLARALKDLPVRIWCRGELPVDGLPGNVTPFSEYECAARLYWQTRPMKPAGERVALAGNGLYAMALLGQGLLTAPPGCAFDLFGDWSLWQDLHREALALPGIRAILRFHPRPWHGCPEAVGAADRVVLCGDDPRENARSLARLRQFYALRGEVHARCAPGLQDALYFGDAASLFTPGLVMKQVQNRLGQQLHELYRSQADDPVPPWEALSDFTRRSNLAAADHLLTKARLLLPEEDVRTLTPEVCARAAARFEAADAGLLDRCRRIEHDRWVLFHALYNWRYAPTRNEAAREHPAMAPYEQLSEAERRKDDNAWRLLATLGEGKLL